MSTSMFTNAQCFKEKYFIERQIFRHLDIFDSVIFLFRDVKTQLKCFFVT